MIKLFKKLRLFFDGQRRVSPAARGRVYAKKGAGAPGGAHQVVTKHDAVLTMKITRANGSIEYVKVPATAERTHNG